MNDVTHETLKHLAACIKEKEELERRLATTLSLLIRQAHRVLSNPHGRYTDKQKAIALLDQIASMLERQATQPEQETVTS